MSGAAGDPEAAAPDVPQHPPEVTPHLPLIDHPRGEVREKAIRLIAETAGYGLYFPALVESLHGREAIQQTTYDYQHLRQFVRELKRTGYIEIERVGPQRRPQDRPLLLYPTEKLAVLKNSRQSPDQRSEDVSGVSGSLPGRAPGGRAARVARGVLRDRTQIIPGEQSEGVRSALRHALAAHRQGVDSAGMRPDRVSSPARVAARQGLVLSAFESAARRYPRGVMITLTSRPGERGDMVDRAVAVHESAGDPLRDHLRYQTPGPSRPESVVFRHVTGRGRLDVHAVVFGVGFGDIDRDALGRFWYETRGHGYVVDVVPIERRTVRGLEGRERRWVFAEHADAPTERGRFVRSYLGEMLFRLREVAEASPEELHAGEVSDAWKVALLWSCGIPGVTISSGLAGGCLPYRGRAVVPVEPRRDVAVGDGVHARRRERRGKPPPTY